MEAGLVQKEQMPFPAILSTYMPKYDIRWSGTPTVDSRLGPAMDQGLLTCWGRVQTYPNMKARRKVDYTGVVEQPRFFNTPNFDDANAYLNTSPNYSAAVLGVLKYAKPEPSLTDDDSQALSMAKDWLYLEFRDAFEKSEIIDLDTSVSHFDMSTSPGYPYSTLYRDKREFLDDGGMEELHMFDQNLLDLPTPCCVWTSSLKEELRKVSKIRDNKIRQFTGAPCTYVAALNRYTLRQNEALYTLHTTTASAVGMSPFYGGWNKLFQKLARFKNGYVGDFEEYDSSLFRRLLAAQADVRWRGICVTNLALGCDALSTHRQRFYKLTKEEIHALMKLVCGLMMQKHLGNPSGTPNTTTNNTFVLFLLLCMYWITNKLGSYSQFKLWVRAALYGDDNTFTVACEIVHAFNGAGFERYCNGIGLTLHVNHEPLAPSSLEFLSCGFAVKNGVAYMKPLKLEKFRAGLLCRDDGRPSTRLSRVCAYQMLLFGAYFVDPHGEAGKLYEDLRLEEARLLKRYDPLLEDDASWLAAKCQRCSDVDLLRLHVPYEARTLALKEDECNSKNVTYVEEIAKQVWQKYERWGQRWQREGHATGSRCSCTSIREG